MSTRVLRWMTLLESSLESQSYRAVNLMNDSYRCLPCKQRSEEARAGSENPRRENGNSQISTYHMWLDSTEIFHSHW